MRHVIITGISRGLGEALADHLLAQPETTVIGLGRHFTEAQLRSSSTTGRLRLHHCDLADPGGMPRRDELAQLLHDARDITVVHNAAVVGPIGPIGQLDPDELIRAATVDFTSTLLLTNELIGALPQHFTRLRILFISSGAAHHVIDGWSAYSAAKRGAEEFFAHLATQLAPDPRVSVQVANPGVMDTRMQAQIRQARFAERERYARLHAEGQLPDPSTVAARLIKEHLLS